MSAQTFDDLVVPLRKNLYGAAMRLTKDTLDAEDLLQDTLLRAHRGWHTFEPGSNVKAWVFKILRNTFINSYHRKNRRLDGASEVMRGCMSVGLETAIAGSQSTPAGPEEMLRSEVTARAIDDALAMLPPDYRAAVTMADLDGLSYKEIAAAMDCPIGTVMSRIYRGRGMLHALLHAHAKYIGILDDGDPGPGERRTQYARTPAPERESDAQLDMFAGMQ